MRRSLAIALAISLVACGRDTRAADAGENPSREDAGLADAGRADGGPGTDLDAGAGADASAGSDGGISGSDAGISGFDAGGSDAGGSGTDGGPGTPDAGGGIDAGPPGGGCVSGATGTHVARFRWEGSGSGSTAYVRYEANTLPDASRWRAAAYSRGAIGSYTPTYVDPFLAEGGLELGGTHFIDVELSTAGLGSVRNATIAIYGRSFNTTTSGSFTWMTFDGSGASPYGGVSNSAPYEWYRANATSALPAGNDGVLLRIEAAGPTNRLVVNRVEICFDAG